MVLMHQQLSCVTRLKTYEFIILRHQVLGCLHFEQTLLLHTPVLLGGDLWWQRSMTWWPGWFGIDLSLILLYKLSCAGLKCQSLRQEVGHEDCRCMECCKALSEGAVTAGASYKSPSRCVSLVIAALNYVRIAYGWPVLATRMVACLHALVLSKFLDLSCSRPSCLEFCSGRGKPALPVHLVFGAHCVT